VNDGFTQAGPALVPSNGKSAASPAPARESTHPGLRFPEEDGGTSLTEMAQRDLKATLQLLAERAQYITGAAGSAIALREGEAMVCWASAGGSAPRVGTHLQIHSGLSGESMRLRQILRCDDAETDPRVNRESCRSLSIASVLVMPLVDEKGVVGVFELFSDRTRAFAERDITALERLGEMVDTALVHAEAARQLDAAKDNQLAPAEETIAESAPAAPGAEEPDSILAVEEAQARIRPKRVVIPMRPAPATKPQPAPAGGPEKSEVARIGKCEACGFPVSPGRSLCLDCESAQARGEPRGRNLAPAQPATTRLAPEPSGSPAGRPEPPAFLAQFQEAGQKPESPGFIAAHKYLLAVLLIAAIVALALLWWRP
jgi:hypothetical protein